MHINAWGFLEHADAAMRYAPLTREDMMADIMQRVTDALTGMDQQLGDHESYHGEAEPMDEAPDEETLEPHVKLNNSKHFTIK